MIPELIFFFKKNYQMRFQSNISFSQKKNVYKILKGDTRTKFFNTVRILLMISIFKNFLSDFHTVSLVNNFLLFFQ